MGRGERIPVKTRREVERMREAGRHVAEILLELRERVAPGVTTAELDAFASQAIARPRPLDFGSKVWVITPSRTKESCART